MKDCRNLHSFPLPRPSIVSTSAIFVDCVSLDRDMMFEIWQRMKRDYSLKQPSIYFEFYSRIVDLNRFFFGSMKFQEADDSQKCHLRLFHVQIKVNVEIKIFIIIVLNY